MKFSWPKLKLHRIIPRKCIILIVFNSIRNNNLIHRIYTFLVYIKKKKNIVTVNCNIYNTPIRINHKKTSATIPDLKIKITKIQVKK